MGRPQVTKNNTLARSGHGACWRHRERWEKCTIHLYLACQLLVLFYDRLVRSRSYSLSQYPSYQDIGIYFGSDCRSVIPYVQDLCMRALLNHGSSRIELVRSDYNKLRSSVGRSMFALCKWWSGPPFITHLKRRAHRLFPYSFGTKVQRDESFAESHRIHLGTQGPIVAQWPITSCPKGACVSAAPCTWPVVACLIWWFQGHMSTLLSYIMLIFGRTIIS
jgi:hypothetical protein